MSRILIGNIKGPMGQQGKQGIQGTIGPVGPQGPLPPLTNTALATVAGVSALDAVMGKTLQDQITKANSDLADKQSKTSDNLIHGTSKYVKANGVSAEAWKTSPVTFLAPTTENSSSRAQVAFENNGFNACIIWLDINGDLRLSDNSGRRYKFNLTEII